MLIKKTFKFRYPQRVKVLEDRVYLPKIGQVKFFKSQEILGKLKQTTVIREGNHWFVCFSCEWEEAVNPVSPTSSNIVGIDVGLKTFAVIYDGEKSKEIKSQKYLAKS